MNPIILPIFIQLLVRGSKDRGSNYVLVRWIEKVIMGGLLWACNRKLIKNAHFFARTHILLSLSL